MKRTLLVLLLAVSQAFAGNVTGVIQTAGGNPIANATLGFTPTMAAVVVGQFVQTASTVNCYTDAFGNVIGIPNPLSLPLAVAGNAGSLTASTTYYIELTYYNSVNSTETVASPELAFTLAPGNSSISITGLGLDNQPASATGYKVYASTTSGAEKLQQTVVGFGGTGFGSLLSVTSPPSNNNSICTFNFSDSLIPQATYSLSIVDSNSSPVPGFPEVFYMQGSTFNLNSAFPTANTDAIFPQAIVSQPSGNAIQSIHGPLTLNGFPFFSGNDTDTGWLRFVESVAPSCVGGSSFIWDDSHFHKIRTCDNGGSTFNFTHDSGLSNGFIPQADTNGNLINSSVTASAITNAAGKNSSSDNTIYLSSAGNDSNDGLSWGTAKLTVQAAFNTATTSGANPGVVQVACGTYTGPTTWYSNLAFVSWGAPDATGNNFGTLPGTGTPCVKVTYASAVTLTGLQNIFVRNIYFDFANGGGNIILNSVANSHWDDVTANQCGNASSPCFLLKTIGTGGPGQNTMNNVFRGTHCIANNGGSGANATCFDLLGQGSVNCVGACGAVTLNEFYNTTCAGGVLHCVDFEKNSDTNHFYGVNCNQDVPIAASSCVSFNELTPASDQDANGELVFNMCVTGTFSAQIRAGQTNGSVISACTGGNGLPSITSLGGTPSFDISTVGLDGVLKATQYSGGTVGTVANNTLGVPSGSVAGDDYAARSSTTGARGWGTDNAQILRSGNQFFLLGTAASSSASIWISGRYATDTNCASSASPSVCGTAAAGSIVIPTGVTSSTLTVNTTAVTANSQIFFYPDDSLGTRLGVTCNSTLATLAGGSFISARSAGVSFAITFNGTISANGVCGSYHIIN